MAPSLREFILLWRYSHDTVLSDKFNKVPWVSNSDGKVLRSDKG